jgi:iron(III) transport system substrate-binding protein
MVPAFPKLFSLCTFIGILLVNQTIAATASPALLEAKRQAEANGYVFYANRDEIVAKAKREGKLRVYVNSDAPVLKVATAAFTKRYPFIQLHAHPTSGGTDAAQALLLQVKSGTAGQDWDVIYISVDFYSQYMPHLWKADILGMAQHRVLQIPPPMIDPKHRNIVAFFSRFQITAYNKTLLPIGKAPQTWEDILKPEFKGRKFAVDIRPTEIAALVPAWGLEKTLAFAKKIAAQEPIWVRGGTRTLTAILAGDVPMMVGPNFERVKQIQEKDAARVLEYVIFEPVPLRLSEEEAIVGTAQNPHAALLWLEWMASAEAQKIVDDHQPLTASVYVRGSVVERELRGKKLSVVDWDHHQSMDEWQAKVFEAYGFPKAEGKR